MEIYFLRFPSCLQFFFVPALVGLFRALPLNRGSHTHTHTCRIYTDTKYMDVRRGGNIMPMDTI